jgi:hypothetical protein
VKEHLARWFTDKMEGGKKPVAVEPVKKRFWQ